MTDVVFVLKACTELWFGVLFKMKLKSVAALVLLSTVALTGCFDKTFEDAQNAMRDGNFQDAKSILIDLANNKSDDNAMYALYEMNEDHPDVMSLEEALGWLQRAADAGRPDAEYEYGLFLVNHDRFEQAYSYFDKAAVWKEERALHFLDKYHAVRDVQIKAEAGNAEGMFEYAKWLLNSKDEESQKEGLSWARKSALQNNVDGQALYATVLYENKDYPNAMSWFEKSAAGGNRDAEYYLGIMYFQGLGVMRNPSQGVENLRKAADKGSALAQFELGRLYINNDRETTKELTEKEAVDYISQAAGQNMLEAQYLLGTMYENGIGVKQDYQRAMNIYRLAALHDHVGAESKLGELYVMHGNEKQKKEGVKWLNKAIEEHDDAEAKTYLAYAYKHGFGVNQNFNQAYKWYREAADVDVASAQFNLGVMIANGHGDARDLRKAAYWIEQAAYNNLPTAMVALALMYEKGAGMEQDKSKARFWYDKAKNLGETDKKKVAELLNL